MIAVISDIHGNFPALKSVIDEIEKIGCSRIVSLGDVAGYYCMINECIELCKKKGIINIMGNHDYYLVNGLDCPRSNSANICLNYQRKIIKPENLDWLSHSVPFIDEDIISYRHGGWDDPTDEYISEFCFDLVKGRPQRIYASGHTHKQGEKKTDLLTYFNPGSVGQPRDYDWRAGFAIIDENQVFLKRVDYPVEEIILAMDKAGFQQKISSCLRTGTKIGEVK